MELHLLQTELGTKPPVMYRPTHALLNLQQKHKNRSINYSMSQRTDANEFLFIKWHRG